MKRLLGMLLVVGFAAGMTAAATEVSLADYHGGGYSKPAKKYYAPKKVYTPKVYKKVYKQPVYSYSGDYPPANCYYEQTYDPPTGYTEGCYPPADWITYCGSKYKSFNVDNGFYFGYDDYYHYCK